jgi:hypothetical protein
MVTQTSTMDINARMINVLFLYRHTSACCEKRRPSTIGLTLNYGPVLTSVKLKARMTADVDVRLIENFSRVIISAVNAQLRTVKLCKYKN